MLGAMRHDPRVRVTAAADLHRDHLERFEREFGGFTFTGAADLCASPLVDVVYVATPHELHVAHATLAAMHGKHVLVEKPMALTLEDCDRMIHAAESAGVVLMVGHTASFNPAISMMRQIVASGRVGALALISATAYTDFLYQPRRPEELVTELGGGIMYNQVPHQVDAVRLVGGGLARTVRASAWKLDPNRPTEGCYTAFLTFDGGAAASLVYSGYDHFLTSKRDGTSGAARRSLHAVHNADGEHAQRVQSGYAGTGPLSESDSLLQPELGEFVVTCSGADLRLTPEGVVVYDDTGMHTIRADKVTGRGAVLDELCSAITRARPPVHDGRWAKATMEVCLAMLQSAREHREVELYHQTTVLEHQAC